ncbi:MAG: NAD kinase [Thiobacillaceae bacterium]|jgi:NAD+ kinase|nr:NAD kinase [Thiobacillaceae bacterium]
MKENFKTIGIVGKYSGAGIGHSLSRLAKYLMSRGHEVLVTAHTAELCNLQDLATASLPDIGARADLAIVMGGDGTLLNVARALVDFQVPMIGINQGRLGFLADVSVDTMFFTLDEMLAGEYVIEDRILLEASVERADDVLIATYAFNDVVVSKSTLGRLIEFEVYIDDQFVYSQRADGLVVASPTGSTAYALSAGGPILHPTLEAFVLAPICPHTLSARPIAVNSRSEIEINLIHADDARVHFDGQQHADMRIGDRVVIRRAKNTVRLLHPENHNYYDTLRQKLHWGEKLS